jgi:predicted AlkP superfamily pyrophosphatase or phosphodiesterase
LNHTLLPRAAAGLIAATLLATVALAAAAPRPGGSPPAPSIYEAGAVTSHVVIVSIDGLRPDAIGRYRALTLQRMLREDAFSLTAETTLPSVTLPSHTSMLTGVPPGVHGITWNRDHTRRRAVVQVPTVFALAKQHGLSTAAFFSKSKLRHLQQPGAFDHVQAPSGRGAFSATRTVEEATRYLREQRPNLIFVHITEPDVAGHAFGWMGEVYGAAVRRSDAAVAAIIEAADDSWGRDGYTIIVTSDHGGTGRSHDSKHPDDVRIPWLARGAGVQPGRIEAGISTMDTAATVLWLLGVPVPADWQGKVVAAAFTPAG